MNSEQLRQIIINHLDLEGLPPHVVGEILVRLTRQSLQQFVLDVYDSLSLDDQKEMKRLFAASDSETVREFIDKKVPNIAEISESATKKVVAQYQKLRFEMAANA
ncbi:MAG: hypothetical protein Q8P93_02175 [bacterium]|nr:hypothetical protein [bacterium]